VPKNGDKPIHGLVSDKNFIVANAVENILAGKSFLAKPNQIFASLPYFFWQLHLSSQNLNFSAFCMRLSERGRGGELTVIKRKKAFQETYLWSRSVILPRPLE